MQDQLRRFLLPWMRKMIKASRSNTINPNIQEFPDKTDSSMIIEFCVGKLVKFLL